MYMKIQLYLAKQDRLSIEGKPAAHRIHRCAFCCCDFELDLMTLTYKPDLDIPML